MKKTLPNFYETLQSIFSPSKHSQLSKVIENSNLPTPCRVLDVGCGSGQDAPLFKDTNRFEYLGLEITESHIIRAKKRFPGMSFRLENLVEKPLDSQSFDLILIDSVLHHLPDAEALLLIERACATLKSGGVFLIQDMIYPAKNQRFALLQNLLIAMDRGKYCRQRENLHKLVQSQLKITQETTYRMLTYDMCLLKCTL